jgi:hypothetical protein
MRDSTLLGPAGLCLESGVRGDGRSKSDLALHIVQSRLSRLPRWPGCGQLLALAEPRTLPYIMPRARRPSSERRTRMNVRAHVPMNPVSGAESESPRSIGGCRQRP